MPVRKPPQPQESEPSFTLTIPDLSKEDKERIQRAWMELTTTPAWRVCVVDANRRRTMHTRDLIVAANLSEYQRGFLSGKIQELTHLISIGKTSEREYLAAKRNAPKQ